MAFILADTTDVQAVRVEETDNVHSVMVYCNFIIGTDATGCMVEFVGEMTNTTVTVNLTRVDNELESVIIHTLPLPLSCYHQVFGIDIEGDGSSGTRSVPGIIDTELSARQCSESVDTPTISKQ